LSPRTGIETPEVNPHQAVLIHKDPIMEHLSAALTLSGFNLKHEAISRTPERMWEVFEVMTRGYDIDVTLERMYDDNSPEGSLSTLQIIPGCKFVSMCEHHFAPFIGEAHVAYLPAEGKVTGLSKIPQLVQKYALRPQLQEKIGQEIANELMGVCKFKDVMVVIEAKHGCEIIEGVKYGYSRDKPYITSTVRGRFETNEKLRNETMVLMGLQR